MDTLSTDVAEDYVYGGHVAIQDVSQHRWYTKQLVVIQVEEELMGFYYLHPATELQEDQDRFEDDPVPVFRVLPRTVPVTVYEPVAA